jgi:hypothetical protein
MRSIVPQIEALVLKERCNFVQKGSIQAEVFVHQQRGLEAVLQR